MKTALIFSGQGSQFIGMGRELYDTFREARDVFDLVDHVLKQHLSKLMFSGDIAELTLTFNTQPAIIAVSMAVLAALLSQGNTNIQSFVGYVAGHSLGEYSALCATSAFSLEIAALLLKKRGNAMYKAGIKSPGGMVALIGTDLETAEKIAQDANQCGLCQIANDNGGGQFVLSGIEGAIKYIVDNAKTYGIKRAMRLPVSGAFHCDLMRSAAEEMHDILLHTMIRNPILPVVTNYTARENADASLVPSLLEKQITGRVRWQESIMRLHDELGVTIFVEIGPGNVLANLVKKMLPDVQVFGVHTPNEIEAFLKTL